jgi:hypothetical protein
VSNSRWNSVRFVAVASVLLPQSCVSCVEYEKQILAKMDKKFPIFFLLSCSKKAYNWAYLNHFNTLTTYFNIHL